MSFQGVEAIEEAVDRAKDILTPFDFITWTRLAIIIVFLGDTGFSSLFFNFPVNSFSTDYGQTYGESVSPFQSAITGQFVDPTQFTTPGIELGTAAPVIGILLVSALIFLYLNSLAQLVMFRGIRDKKVRIRRNIAKHYVDAAKYFLFNIFLSTVVLLVVFGWVSSIFVNPLAGALLTLVIIPLMLILVVFNGLVHDFGLQKVIESDRGFIESISEVLKTARAEWKEVGVYLVTRLFIAYAVRLMTLVAVAIVSVLFLMVFGLLAALFGFISPPLALVPIVVGALLWIVTILYVSVPFKTYMYSYFVEVYDGVFG